MVRTERNKEWWMDGWMECSMCDSVGVRNVCEKRRDETKRVSGERLGRVILVIPVRMDGWIGATLLKENIQKNI